VSWLKEVKVKTGL